MFTELMASGSGGGSMALDTITITGTVSDIDTYEFTKDFDLVVLLANASSSRPTWYVNNIAINGSAVTSNINGGSASGSIGSGGYTRWATISNIKSGDRLSIIDGGTYYFIMLGFN